MNRLKDESSAYLKHAATQKIDWHPWGDEAFQKAKSEDKPIFLSSGAVWCHWCHVMAEESFNDDEVAKLANERFICIKLDRDERPDIDRRYQLAVGAMGHGAGWPLTVFLTPDGKPFFGGTYFPPEEKWGRPGFKELLLKTAEFYQTNKDGVHKYAQGLLEALRATDQTRETPTPDALDFAVEAIMKDADENNGGWGGAPKFPMPGLLEFLMQRYSSTHDQKILDAVVRTLNGMSNGGMYDHVGGGFHRYSTDAEWIIPHFEKMADDNAWLLRNYSSAYALFKDESYRKTAEGIAGFMMDVLSDPEGGFYASQDADVNAQDEGGYFTWSINELKTALQGIELETVKAIHLDSRGEMHNDPDRRVLFFAKSFAEAGALLGMSIDDIQQIHASAIKKLRNIRLTRQTPLIDKTFYASINGLAIASFLRAHRALSDDRMKDFAIKSLLRVKSLLSDKSILQHCAGVKGMFEDYLFMAEGFFEAYQSTGDKSFLDESENLMKVAIEKFIDSAGGFKDSEDDTLGIKIRSIEDVPHPSPNAVAISLLVKLSHATNKPEYLRLAEDAIAGFYKRAVMVGLHSGYYFFSLDRFFNQATLTIR